MTTDFQMPLTKIKRQGSIHKGASHWLGQRLSAIALVFLSIWFLVELIYHLKSDYHTVLNWIAQPWIGALLALFVGTICYHSSLGLRVIIEDYVPSIFWQKSFIILTYFLNLAISLLSWFFIMRIEIIAKG